MKSFYLFLIGVLLAPTAFAQIDSSSSYFQQFQDEVAVMNTFKAENFVNTFEVPSFENDVVTVDYEALNPPQDQVEFLKSMLALSAGFGLIESQTLWCLGASYFYNLRTWQTMALYGALGFMYSGFSNDGVSQNIVDFQLQLLMFTTIMKLQEIRFVYGLLVGYGLGTEKFDNFKYDINRFTLAAVLGLQLLMSPRWSLLLQTNVFAYQSLKLKPESGGEFSDNVTGLFLNKNSLLTLSVLFYLGNRSQ